MERTSYDMPMKWHKFLIYFSLWAGAVLCFLNAFRLLTGSQYGSADIASQVYQNYGGLKSVDTIFGVLYILVGIFMIYVRFQLANFKEGAPNKLTIVYALQMIVSLGYAMAASGTVNMPLSQVLDSQMTSSIATGIVMMIANRVYYNKRSHLFGGSAPSSASSYAAAAGTGAYASAAGTGLGSPDAAPSSGTYTAPAPETFSSAGGFCPNCGAAFEAGDAFCAYCGTKLN